MGKKPVTLWGKGARLFLTIVYQCSNEVSYLIRLWKLLLRGPLKIAKLELIYLFAEFLSYLSRPGQLVELPLITYNLLKVIQTRFPLTCPEVSHKSIWEFSGVWEEPFISSWFCTSCERSLDAYVSTYMSLGLPHFPVWQRILLLHLVWLALYLCPHFCLLRCTCLRPSLTREKEVENSRSGETNWW